MGKQHKIGDLSIAAISLISILFHFLFPNIAIAAGINHKSVISFNLLNQVKPYSIARANINNQKTNAIPDNNNALNYPISAVVVDNSKKDITVPIRKPAENKISNIAHEEFTEYIVKDRYIDAQEEAMLAAGNLKVISKKKVLITAYSSTPDQTDSTPFITAANTHVHDGIIASNFLPFGTKVRIPAMFQGKIFTVEDRMKSDTKVDIWFSSRQEAMNFGARVLEIEIVEKL